MLINSAFKLLCDGYIINDAAARARRYTGDKSLIDLSLSFPTESVFFRETDIKREIAKSYEGVSPREVFLFSGKLSALFFCMSLLEKGSDVLIPLPAPYLYNDAAAVSGMKVSYIFGSAENAFLPIPQEKNFDALILGSPNSAGCAYSKEALKKTAEAVKDNNALFIFDSSMSDYNTSGDPKSIYSIPGADAFGIELGFYKRKLCFVIIPEKMRILHRSAERLNISASQENKEEPDVRSTEYYLRNAFLLKTAFRTLSHRVFGGDASPLLFVSGSKKYTSELYENGIIVSPPALFGIENYFRVSAFCTFDECIDACDRIITLGK